VRHLAKLALLLTLLSWGRAEAQFCPCYSSTSASNTNDCAIPEALGTNPTLPEWQAIIEAACAGPDGPSWGTGPLIPVIGKGCGSGVKVAAHFPCELVEAILMQESRWLHFCSPTTPPDKKDLSPRTIISFDCGYGVGQVTSGMHVGETPDFDRDRVAAEPSYSVQVSLKILAEKWRTTACTGDNQPSIVENWYLATWAYNGYAFVNNPNNPNLDAMRPVCDPNVGCAGRTYQERIWGWMEHPPADARWAALAPAYPDLSELPTTSGPKPTTLSEPACASPTSCTQARAIHASRCLPPVVQPKDLATGEPVDASQPDEVDAAMTPPDPDPPGCGCSHSGAPLGGLRLVLLALLGLGLLRRRARRA